MYIYIYKFTCFWTFKHSTHKIILFFLSVHDSRTVIVRFLFNIEIYYTPLFYTSPNPIPSTFLYTSYIPLYIFLSSHLPQKYETLPHPLLFIYYYIFVCVVTLFLYKTLLYSHYFFYDTHIYSLCALVPIWFLLFLPFHTIQHCLLLLSVFIKYEEMMMMMVCALLTACLPGPYTIDWIINKTRNKSCLFLLYTFPIFSICRIFLPIPDFAQRVVTS